MPTGIASSPAVQLLNCRGVKVLQVAAVANTTPATASRWLSGVHQYPEDLPSVLALFLDPGDVDQVLAAIPRREEANPN